MKCDKCSVEIAEGDEHELQGKKLCEDCFIAANKTPQGCGEARIPTK
jgi:hypothetical protein